MTAEEYMMENMQGTDFQEIESALIGFATLKCKELLEIVAEKAKVYNSKNGADIKYLSIEGDWITVNKDSILNAVDLNSFIV